MKYINTIIILAFCALVLAPPLRAIDENAGTSGLQFLKIGLGAKQLASGESACASAEDSNTIFWNPAGLTRLEKRQISLSHNQWIDGISEQSVTFNYPGEKWHFGGGILYLHMGDLTGYDIDAQGKPVKIADFTSYDMAAIFSCARVYEGVSVGLNVKLFQEKIENTQGSGAAIDIGASKSLMENLVAGVVLQNAGTSVKFIEKETQLPLNIKAGLAYRMLSDRLLLTADVNKPNDNAYKGSFGAGYKVADSLAFRAGYNDKTALNSSITFGLGINISEWTVDYAYVPYGKLGDTHRISLTTGF
ncbi:MAG: PorV/PorQ family protein [Elusimicrobiota bacterium]